MLALQKTPKLRLFLWRLPCRFVFVVEGNVQVKHDGKAIDLAANDYAYFPPGSNDT